MLLIYLMKNQKSPESFIIDIADLLDDKNGSHLSYVIDITNLLDGKPEVT